VAAYHDRKAKSQDYGKLLWGLLPSLRRVAKAVPIPDGDRLLAGMEAKLRDPALLQGAHRRLLLALAKLQ
jgi:hypothetical protein